MHAIRVSVYDVSISLSQYIMYLLLRCMLPKLRRSMREALRRKVKRREELKRRWQWWSAAFVDCKEFGVLPCSYCDYVCCLGHLRRLYSLRGQVCDICDAPLGLPGPPWGPPEDPFRVPLDWPRRPAMTLPIARSDRSRSRSRSL